MSKISKIRVLHICKVYLPVKGGVQVVVDWVSKALNESGVDSNVLTTANSESERQYMHDQVIVNTARSYGQLLSLPIAPSIIWKIWKSRCQYDVFAIHYPFPLADIAIAFMLKRNIRIVIYWHSEIVSQKYLSHLIRPFTKIMLNKADKIICSSPNLIEYSGILQKYKKKCEVIPFGKPENKCKPTPIDPSQSNVILFVGRHVPYKGIDTLIKAFSDAKTRLQNSFLKLTIVGNGPLLSKHKELTKRLGLGSDVDFLANVEDDELAILFSKCRCLVLPSTMASEAFALVQLEAMSFGRPIINTKLQSGVPWVARHDKEALTVLPNSETELSQAIADIASDDDLVKRLGSSAYKRQSTVFSRDRFCSETLALFESVYLDNHD